eukprot:scaffold63856_cov29-Prasinocladus_malaysianus.AAC.1
MQRQKQLRRASLMGLTTELDRILAAKQTIRKRRQQPQIVQNVKLKSYRNDRGSGENERESLN